ncbi:MAG: long-chain fatty acid--CoA ligase [Actinomycetota bacterium]
MTATTATNTSGRAEAVQDTIVGIFRRQAAQLGDRVALRSHADGSWNKLSWRDYGTAVEEAAAGLIELGVEPGDRVGLLSSNLPEWHTCDLAILSAGAATVPVYPTSTSSQVAYVLADSGAVVCFVQDAAQLAKVLLHRDELPDLRRIVLMTGAAGLDQVEVVIGLDDLRHDGVKRLGAEADVVADRAAGVEPASLATLVYTSGTTGPPKGTRLNHGNITWTIDAMRQLVDLRRSDRFLSYLPLSHIAERVTSHFGQIVAGGQTWFARSLVTVPEDLRSCRPTIFFAVPRVWQKFRDAIAEQIDDQPLPLRLAFDQYIGVGHAMVEARQEGRSPSPIDQARYLPLHHTLGARVRKQLGLDAARVLVSSAAPIHPDLLRWFHAIGLPIAEVWGQTEDCGPATVNPPDAIRIGTVGRPLPGLEVRTGEDGELLVRGGSVCEGYHGKPDDTADLIDEEGWLHSGDLGAIDPDGYVRITGRKKDLIINAAGKNISPSEIESRLSMERLIGQAVVVGDGRRYLVGLLTLDLDAAAEWAREHGTFTETAALVQDPELRAEVEAAVERVNREHAPVEQLKRWRLLPEPLTVESGELTPTMKVKRSVVQDNNADLVEEMYAER